MMGDLMRQAAHQRQLENLAEKERSMFLIFMARERDIWYFQMWLKWKCLSVKQVVLAQRATPGHSSCSHPGSADMYPIVWSTLLILLVLNT